MSITEIAIKRPSLIIVIFSVLFLGGFISYRTLSYELMPDFAEPTLTITVLYPGASPSEVESSVTKKVEDAVSALENISDINSKSMESLCAVIVNFKAGTDLDLVMQEAQRKIDNIKATLPEGVKSPSISKLSPSDMPFMQITATSTIPAREFYDLVDDKILPQLQQIKGVAEITMLGGEQREIRININKDKLKFYNLSLLQVNQAIATANIDVPTGKVKTPDDQTTVRLAGKFVTPEDIRNLVVFTPQQGSPVRIGDVAEVNDAIKDIASISRYNGQEGIGLLVKKQSDANAVRISQEIKNRIEGIEKMYASQQVKFIIAVDDTDFTLESVNAVQHDLVIAIILVAAVMLLFLHSLRNAIIVMVAIPASLVSTFIAMALLDYSLNLMTLLAMSLVIGILVDDSIVVLENITRHLEMGKDKRTAAIDGRKEIGFSAMAITFVDVVVFLPIVFVNTTIGDILRQFSMMVVISTLMSLFVSFTITPWLVSRFGKLEHLNPKNPFHWILLQFEKGLDSLTDTYVAMLRWSLHHKIMTALIVIAIFVGTGAVMSMDILGEELVAQGDQGKFTLRLEYDKRTTISRNNLQTLQIEKYLLSQPEVVSVFSNVAGPTVGFGIVGQGSPNVSELTVTLVPAEQRKLDTEKYMIGVKEELEKKYAGLEVGSNVIGIASAGAAPIELLLTGADYSQLIATGKKVKAIISALPGANDIQMSVEDGMPEVTLHIDRERMANLGLDMGTVGATLQTAFTGNDDSKYRENGNEYDIRIMMDAFDRKNPEDVANITFLNQRGELVKLSQFATISQSIGASQLERKNRVSSLTITGWNLGLTTGKLSQAIDQAIADSKVIPDGVTFEWGGDTKRQVESMGALMNALLIGFVMVYLIMVALYDSFVYPFVVLFSIPVALIGALLALNIAMSSMSIFAMLGIIMLLGLVAKNAILLVDFTNQMKAEGYRTYMALLLAGKTRLRPIIMTTVAMVIGMLPIAIAKGAGAEWKNGLALVLIGGLTSSMLLTVFIVPVAYYSVDRIGEKWRALTGKRKVKEEASIEINA